MPILTCPGCGRGGLRIPDGRRGKVTCPRCGAEWFYPETIELSEVEFRCSETGARFVIQLSRRSPLHKFVVQGIKNAPPRPTPPSGKERQVTSKSTNAVAIQDTPLGRVTGPTPGRWLARMFGKTSQRAASTSVSVAKSTIGTSALNLLRHDANEYNWASFLCPYCGSSSFLKCAAGHLVCDGTVEMRNGRRFYQCFCGSAGFIEGAIKDYEARQCIVKQTETASPPSDPVSAAPAKEALASPSDQQTETPINRLLR